MAFLSLILNRLRRFLRLNLVHRLSPLTFIYFSKVSFLVIFMLICAFSVISTLLHANLGEI